MQYVNDVEVLQPSADNNDYVRLPAAVADVWADGDFIKSTAAGVISKFAPTDSTTTADQQNYIIGISSGGKRAGDNLALVCKKATILIPADSTNNNLGATAVIVYDYAAKYSVKENVAWQASTFPLFTNSNDFAIYAEQGRESDGRIKVLIDGNARINALN